MVDSDELSADEVDEVTREVQAGAALLDGNAPGWAARVPADEKLELPSADRDVLSWVYGSYKRGLSQLGLDSGDSHGFDFPCDIQVPNGEETPMEILIDDYEIIERAEANVWATLRTAWIREIQQRLDDGVAAERSDAE
jgi:hypothetical protein